MKLGKNQYYITKNQDIKLEYEKKYSIFDYNLYCGKDVKTVVCTKGESALVTIGYACDVENTELDENEICRTLIEKADAEGLSYADFMSLGGRWVMLFINEQRLIAWGDACGLRQLFYAKGENTALASQAKYIAYELGFSEDAEASEYLALAKSRDKEFSLPLDSSLYKEVKRLLPNYCFSSDQNNAVRISLPVEQKNTKNSTALMAKMLERGMFAINKRYPMAITLTAGWDSRIVTASAVPIRDSVTTVTLKYQNMPKDSLDIKTAEQLSKEYGFRHRLISCEAPEHDFCDEYIRHSENAHEYWIEMEDAIRRNGLSESMWVKGSCCEIMRSSFGVLPNRYVDADILLKLYDIPSCNFSERVIEEWLKSARREKGYSLLDLFYWEHRMGSWLAECLNEADVVGENYTPFNVRALLLTGLSVNRYQRTAPGYKFFDRVIRLCGIDNSKIPINHGRYNGIKSRLKLIVKNRMHCLYYIILKSKR